MIEIRPTVDEADLRRILSQPRDIELAADATPDDFIRRALTSETTGATMFEDGIPIAAGGLTPLEPPFAAVWLLASRELKPYREVLLAEVHERIEAALKEGFVLLATVTRGQEVAEKFAKRLGFKPSPAVLPHQKNVAYYLKATR